MPCWVVSHMAHTLEWPLHDHWLLGNILVFSSAGDMYMPPLFTHRWGSYVSWARLVLESWRGLTSPLISLRWLSVSVLTSTAIYPVMISDWSLMICSLPNCHHIYYYWIHHLRASQLICVGCGFAFLQGYIFESPVSKDLFMHFNAMIFVHFYIMLGLVKSWTGIYI